MLCTETTGRIRKDTNEKSNIHIKNSRKNKSHVSSMAPRVYTEYNAEKFLQNDL